LQESSVGEGPAAAMDDTATEDAGVGAVNPIGNAHALMRVSEPTAVATTTMPTSAYAMVVRIFGRRTDRSRGFTWAGGNRLAIR